MSESLPEDTMAGGLSASGSARRLPYRAPEVVRVKLASEEMAAGACKRSTTSAGQFTGCTRLPAPCRLAGS